MRALVTWTWLAVAAATQSAPAQEAWLKGFEGGWVVDNARGDDASIVLSIVRDGSQLLLKVNMVGEDVVTRYDLSGASAVNTNFGSKAIFRTRLDKQKLITQIWTDAAVGPPERIETRYLESADVMVVELTRSPEAPAFNRTVMRRKAK